MKKKEADKCYIGKRRKENDKNAYDSGRKKEK